jgi:membrane protease YdiL (CAAX protease family)
MPQWTERTDPQVERWSGLALIPMLTTAGYYALPSEVQAGSTVQFTPQILAYVSLALWARHNGAILRRLGLTVPQFPQGVRWGVPVGIVLGAVNTMVILHIAPWLGADITFLRDTPHARAPTLVMLPWAILLIAIGVELNFRGFLLGRLVALFHRSRLRKYPRLAGAIGILVSALMFSFDPFMVSTFHHLHWIAVWDGLAWGMMWVRLRNLFATIIAHAIEVMVMYSVLKLLFKS